MASNYGADPDLKDLPRRELDELRRETLLEYMVIVVAIVVLWLIKLSWRNQVGWSLDLAVIAPVVGVCLALLLREKHRAAACWSLLLGLIFSDAFIMLAAPSDLTMAFGCLIVIASHALLSSLQAFAAMALTWGANMAAWHIAAPTTGRTDVIIAVAALYLLTWVATAVAGRSLHRSVEIALTGWAQLRAALVETRERKAELYRVVRALEEATYRMQRMNNELLLARETAEAARATKAHFASIVSHELRGPLNLILGFSRLMALSPETYPVALPGAYRADVDTIYENSQHLVALLDDILDLSGMEINQIPLTKDQIDLQRDVIDDVLTSIRPLTERRGLTLRMEKDDNLPLILADKGRLRQVLLNLLTNAVRFTERGGITIHTILRGDNLEISVKDTGRGIAADQMAHLFQEFQQLHAGNEHELKGTGLGLAISKYIVELHGGRIWAESIQGKGTAVYFSVPWRHPEPLSGALVGTADSLRLHKAYETCLIVHDDPLAVRLLARHIRDYRVVGLAREEEALALLEELHPKAIITSSDQGHRLFARLARTSFDVPILTCALPHLTQSPIEGAMMYLMKPVTSDMLAAAMRQVDHAEETTVLLVDDDRDAVRLLEMMLGVLPRPYRILKAYSGLQALRTMRDTMPDIVFMDLLMPEMDGQETISQMRADENLRGIPVVIISAHDYGDQAASLGTSLTLLHRQPISVSRGAVYLKALLDVLSPSYLPGPVAVQSPPEGSPVRSASSVPLRLPGSKPDSVGR